LLACGLNYEVDYHQHTSNKIKGKREAKEFSLYIYEAARKTIWVDAIFCLL
jgi:hypothetical protein